MKVFSVAGYSKTGKTTTAVKLISMLANKGFKVAAIKDIHNEDFTMEREGSNTHLMQKAGAQAVFARGLQETFLIRPERMALNEMLTMLNADWVVVEGMKKAALPRIICAESIEQLDELIDDTVIAISGKISNQITEYKDLPVINILERPELLLALIEEKIFKVLPLSKEECCSACGLSCYQMVGEILKGRIKREDCILDKQEKITLKIAGKNVLMVPFVGNLLYDLVHAFAANLKGYNKGNIDIHLSSYDKE